MLTASTLPRGSLRGISPQTTARSARHDCVLKNTNSQTFISDTVGNVLGSGEDSPTVWGKCRAATKGDGLCTACSPAGVQGAEPPAAQPPYRGPGAEEASVTGRGGG